MKKIFISLWLLLALAQLSLAQNNNNNSAPASFGCASSNGATSTCNVPFIMGQAIYSNYIATAQCHDGFPYDAQYMQNTFVGGLWSSKGYFSDYVLLQWSIANNASSITSFVVSRRLLSDTSATYQVVATLDPTVMSWQDQYCETGTLYQYKVYASGITSVLTLNLNYVTAIGFRQPIATATGRITYAGGTAVPGVSVLAQTSPATPTSALGFDGKTSTLSIYETQEHASLTSGKEFTFQAWINDTSSTNGGTIFDKTNVTTLHMYQATKTIEFDYFDANRNKYSITLSYASLKSGFIHLTAIRDITNSLILQLNDGVSVLRKKQTFSNSFCDHAAIFGIGSYAGGVGAFFPGLIDEIRIWSIALDSATIQRDYSRVLTGTETGLEAYYPCNEGVGAMAYDVTHTGNNYNGNDATLTNVGWTNNTPPLLYIKGITDANGSYQISGIPYSADGSSYTFTPMFGVHTFNPTQALRYFAPGSNVSNNVDFTDNSSFTVMGNVMYDNTDVPVQGVNVLVDGVTAINNRTPVVTDAQGNFTIDVPIGFHRITLAKNGHTFVDGFPTKTYIDSQGNLDSLFDFENDIVSRIQFFDATLATLAGRVAGGTVQQAKPLGFGLSKANLGYGKITLNLQANSALLREKTDSITTPIDSLIHSSYSISGYTVNIYPDTITGEYAVKLPPGTYTVSSAYGNAYNAKKQSFINTDYDFSTQTGALGQIILDINKKDSSQYNFTDSVLNKKTNKNVAYADTAMYRFNQRYDFIWRNTPTIQVAQANQKFFGDSLIQFSKTGDTLHVIKKQPTTTVFPDPTDYYFSYPIFHQNETYTFGIKVFEAYTNNVSNYVDVIPQTDGGTLSINNALATTHGFSDTLDAKGALTYTFTGGVPNIVSPYLLSATVAYTYKLNNSQETVNWLPATSPTPQGLTGIILGASLSGGSNFITTGPTKIDMILRDPPGANSSTYLEEGTTFTNTTTTENASVWDLASNTTAFLGAEVEVAEGLGVMVIQDLKSQDQLKLGLTQNITKTWGNSTAYATTNTQQWSTSSDPLYVGTLGDVFIGHSTNIVFSRTLNVGIVEGAGTALLTTASSYAMSPQFGTAFQYSQDQILNYLIPNLISIRNNFFIQQPDVYIPHTNPPTYSNKTTTRTITGDTIIGDAYTFIPYNQIKDCSCEQASDSIAIYNQWIAGWDTVIAQNERVKVLSLQQAQANGAVNNISFDAGTTYQNTQTNDSSYTSTTVFHSETNLSLDNTLGFQVNGIGCQWEISSSNGYTYDQTNESTSETSTTYNYTLTDANEGDYFSVDIVPAIDHFGPVFHTRGGQSMCPYEGQDVTQFYNPGTALNVATEQMEIPNILVNENKNASQINVPSTQQAYFTLNLQNLTQTGNNDWMDLNLVSSSNPNGAIITVDGQALVSNTLSFMIPALGGVTKTLAIAMGAPDTFSYHNIGIVLRSQCQGDPTTDIATIADTVWVNVNFTPACTPVTLSAPLDQWTMNGITGSSLPLQATGYNANLQNFQSISFEYKPSSSSTWLPLAYFFNDTTSTLYKDEQSTKGVIPAGGTVSFTWDASEMADQSYDIRTRSNCADEITSYSTVASGIKDLSPLQVFGTPQPSTGILGIGENISVEFNKPIVAGDIQPDYVQVNGVLNGSSIAHATSLNLDGVSGYAKADGFSFTNSPFTVEFWMQRPDANDTGVVFSYGTSAADKIEIANSADGKLQVSIGAKTYAVDASIIYNTTTPENAWHHYALVYDTTKTLTLYGDENTTPLLSETGVNYSPQQRSSVYLGRSVSGASYGQAYMDEIRIWNTARLITDVAANMSVQLSGSEQGLVAYWQCNEGSGTLAADRAGSHNLSVNTSWEIALTNQAVSFDATKKQALVINGRQLDLSNQQNATIEFWFKAGTQASRACLFSNGVVDSTAKGVNPYAFGLFIEPTGLLTLTAGGTTENATIGKVSDNAWHHFALVIDRLNNVRTYLDGALQEQLPTSIFSGIVGLDMYVGAFHNQITSTTSSTNQYYTGLIDEFRIWETARPASLISKYKNTKLTGTESGLLYYFPFEEYYNMSNVQTLRTTYNNKVDSNSLIASGVARTDTVVARALRASFTSQAPAVKDAQPLTNLAVTYEVNNDELLINLPTQYASLYENCVLEMSVRNIFDENGNMLQSPAQWTAFVQQNPVVWSSAADTLNLLTGQGGSFTATVDNKGGVAKDFTINGLPVWLTANPQSGTVQPASTQTITFTVNAGLNIGSYSAPINLTTDYGYDEKLQVYVNVNAQKPAWTVNPANYQYSMNVFGTVQIGGVIATNTNDMVAAFVNDTCRGVCTLTALSNFDVDEAMLTIYSNKQTGDTVTFLVWDANTGKTYSNVTPVYTFTSDVVYGSPKTSVIISCGTDVRNSYALNAGWNWISINVNNAQSNSVENLLGSIGSNHNDEILGQKSYDQFDTKAGWSGTLDATGINAQSMYKIDLAKAGTVSIDGTPVDPDSVSVPIVAGWNWIGYIPQYNETTNEALASYGPHDGDVVKSQKAFSMFYTGIGWIGTLSNLTPCNGYMLQAAEASSLVYPQTGLLKSFGTQNNPPAPKVLAFNGGHAKSNATIIAQVADSTVEVNGKVLAAYSGTQCTGFAYPIATPKGKTEFFLVSDIVADTNALKFALVDTATGTKTAFVNTLANTSDNHSGEIDSPYLLYTSGTSSLVGARFVSDVVSAYPNPFSSTLNITGYLEQESPLCISMVNVLGTELLQYTTTGTKGAFLINLTNQGQIALNELPKGWYEVTVKTNAGTSHINVLKQ